MKIFIDGGRRPAVRRICDVWSNKHTVVNTPKGADVQLSMIRIRHKTHLPVLLRLDGVYYDKADNYKSRNAAIDRAHNSVEAVVYQSHLSKKMCEKYLSKRKTNVHDVVYNGVDSTRWMNFEQHGGINIVSCAKWRRHKRLPETVELFAEFLNKYPGAKLHILGPMSKGAKVIKHGNVVYHNPKQQIGSEEIKAIYKTCDMYIHLSKKDSCPSSVAEAIAAGMPVVTTDACGGATEMCKLTEGCVVVVGEDMSLEPDYIYRDPYNKLPIETKEGLLQAMYSIAEDRRRVVLPEELTIDYVAGRYIKLMEEIL